jgi:hypothetical protein
MAVIPVDEDFRDDFPSEEQKSVLIRRLRNILDEISAGQQIEKNELLDALKLKEEPSIPVEIFANKKLGILEAAVKYLREEKGFSLTEIAQMLNRDRRTVWSTYDFAQKKCPQRVFVSGSRYWIPVSVFTGRDFGVLESLTTHLIEHYRLKFSQIAVLLQRDQRTIWTVYNRAKKKRPAK